MLHSEMIAVCSKIHTKHINTLCGQNVDFVLNLIVDQVPMWDLWWTTIRIEDFQFLPSVSSHRRSMLILPSPTLREPSNWQRR